MSNSRMLTEWLDANGNKASINNNSSSANSSAGNSADDLFKDRFVKLAKQIEDCQTWSLVNYISEWELDLEFDTGEAIYSLDIDVNSKNIAAVIYNNSTGAEILNVTAGHDEWHKIILSLKNKNIIQDVKACESIDTTTADDFKLYENLWD